MRYSGTVPNPPCPLSTGDFGTRSLLRPTALNLFLSLVAVLVILVVVIFVVPVWWRKCQLRVVKDESTAQGPRKREEKANIREVTPEDLEREGGVAAGIC